LKKLFISSILLYCFLTEISFAQEIPPIETDRPDQTESAAVVPKDHFQIECGFSYEKEDLQYSSSYYPSVLWKYGVNDKFELRLITELTTSKFLSSTTTGIGPVAVGFKTKLAEEKGIWPVVSFIGHIAIPEAASSEFKLKYYAPDFRFAMQHTLSENISVGYNLGAEWDGFSAEPVFIYSFVTAYSFTSVTAAYIEIYGFAPQYMKSDHRLDGGITFTIKPNLMLDLSGGFGITENAPEYYIGAGVSARFPD